VQVCGCGGSKEVGNITEAGKHRVAGLEAQKAKGFAMK
jgi:hypothetical protein